MGTNTIIILVLDSGFAVISSPTDVLSALSDIINLAAGNILNRTRALATKADYNTLTEVVSGGTIKIELTTNVVG